MSQFFASGGYSTGTSASASVFSVNIQDWFPIGRTGWICFQSKGLLRTPWTVWKGFCHTTKWISYKYTYALFLLWLPPTYPPHPLGHHGALSWAPCYFLNTYCIPDLIIGLGIYWWPKPRQKFDFYTVTMVLCSLFFSVIDIVIMSLCQNKESLSFKDDTEIFTDITSRICFQVSSEWEKWMKI